VIVQTISHYRILEPIGEGGMGVVCKAEDIRLGRQVAIKFLPAALAANREALDRFQGEARAASSLNHANICTLLDVGGPEDQPFLVMELLEGHALSRRIAGKPLPPSECRCYPRHPGAGRHQPEKAAARHRAVKIRDSVRARFQQHHLRSRLGKTCRQVPGPMQPRSFRIFWITSGAMNWA
jgi:hypothetical protein